MAKAEPSVEKLRDVVNLTRGRRVRFRAQEERRAFRRQADARSCGVPVRMERSGRWIYLVPNPEADPAKG